MSLLIDQNGHVFENSVRINQLLSPVQVGRFIISDDAREFMKNDMDDSNVDHLFRFIPKEMDQLCRQTKGLVPTKASVFKLTQQAGSQERSDASQTPHINAGNEVHFFFDGSYIIYFSIDSSHYSLIVQAGDWLYIPANVEHWIKPTEDNYLVIVSYHSEPFEIFHSKVTYTQTQSKTFL
jgi:cupin superfamily acireductone dioxygenase involved in methionine salvage